MQKSHICPNFGTILHPGTMLLAEQGLWNPHYPRSLLGPEKFYCSASGNIIAWLDTIVFFFFNVIYMDTGGI